MTNFISGVLSGILATFICLICKKIWDYIKKYRNSEYSGDWTDEIYDSEGNVLKRDNYNIKHNKKNNTIYGTIRRYYPEEQNHREWNFNGVIDGHYYIIFSFWSKDMQKSNGCVYAKLNDNYIYEGFYLEEHNSIIDMTPIKLHKKREVKK